MSERIKATFNDTCEATLELVIAGAAASPSLRMCPPASWEEIINAICGLWLIVSPLIFGYSAAGQLRFWHFGLGALVTIIALVELWQDRQRQAHNSAPQPAGLLKADVSRLELTQLIISSRH
jgi:hypothetical protein